MAVVTGKSWKSSDAQDSNGLLVEKSNQPPLSGRTPRTQCHVDRSRVVPKADGSVSPGSLPLGISSFSEPSKRPLICRQLPTYTEAC